MSGWSIYLILLVGNITCFLAGLFFATGVRKLRKRPSDPLLEVLSTLRHLEQRCVYTNDEEAKYYLNLARACFEQALSCREFPADQGQNYYQRAVCSFHIQNAGTYLSLADRILNTQTNCDSGGTCSFPDRK